MEYNRLNGLILVSSVYSFYCLLSVVLCNQTINFTEVTSDQSISETTNTSEKVEFRVFLVKEIFDEEGSSSNSEEVDSRKERKRDNNTNSTTTQIYIITVIGITPAAIGAIMWWIKGLKRKCVRNKNLDNKSKDIVNSNANPLSVNENEIGQITYKIIQRAEKLNGSGALWYNTYKPSSFVKSRRVYSLELPRKNLEMIELLGEGNFGQVWKAKAVNLSPNNGWSIVAVKTNKTNSNEKEADDLIKELDIMLQLGTHPNVVRLLGCCTVNEPYYLILEYVSMGKLLTFLRDHRADRTYYNSSSSESNGKQSLSSRDLISFAYQTTKGMEFINSHGIIHRDLAARNVLIDNCNNCKIADFGLSRSIRDKEADMYEQRTNGEMPIRWMSPESLFLGQFSSKSDVWAFGIFLWEVVTLGATPYPGMGAQEVIRNVKQGQMMDRPDHCSYSLYQVMKSCWAMDPHQRPTFTDLRTQLVKMMEKQSGYVDLQHYDNNLYYNLYTSPGEKV